MYSQLCHYPSMLTGGGRAFDISDPLFPDEGMMVSPSDLSLSTKLSTSLPLAPSFRALLDPLALKLYRITISCQIKINQHDCNAHSKPRTSSSCASNGCYLTGVGVILGFSGSTMVSVIMDPEETLVMPPLPKPPKAGTFFPERSASFLACWSSLAFLLISALASLSWVCITFFNHQYLI